MDSDMSKKEAFIRLGKITEEISVTEERLVEARKVSEWLQETLDGLQKIEEELYDLLGIVKVAEEIPDDDDGLTPKEIERLEEKEDATEYDEFYGICDD